MIAIVGKRQQRRKSRACSSWILIGSVLLFSAPVSLALDPQRAAAPLEAAAAPLEAAAAPFQAPTGAPVAPQGLQQDKDGFTKWPSVDVVSVGGPTAFGWVATKGDALGQANVNERTCALIGAKRKDGQAFDVGANQRAFFVGVLELGDIKMAADVRYLPDRSLHELCYTPPAAGLLKLELRLVFINYKDIVTTIQVANNKGFTHYTVVLVASVQVNNPAGGDFEVQNYRSTLPLCSPDLLAGTGNKGYWMGDTWMLEVCRLSRLKPAQMKQCLNGKDVLMIGDSEVRYLYGLMQLVMMSKDRDGLAAYMKAHPFDRGSLLDTLHLPTDDGVDMPPVDATGQAKATSWNFLGQNSTFYGSIYHGFSRRQVAENVDGQDVSFSVTYSSYFFISKPIFEDWKLSGQLSGGTTVTNGGQYDMVLMANQLHDVAVYNSAKEYADKLTTYALPNLQKLLKTPGSFFMFGGLTSMEQRKLNAIYLSGNPRIVEWEDAGYRAVTAAGLPNFLLVRHITAPRQDLAYDSTHYKMPVNLAMLDLWMGSYCASEDNAI